MAVTCAELVLWNAEGTDGHADPLPLYVSQALEWARSEGVKIDAIAVSIGPGSYTGLRIGLSMAKGLCYGLDVPLIAVSTRELLGGDYQLVKGCWVGAPTPPLARNMGALAARAYDKREFEDVAYIEPFYMRPYEAKLPTKLL